MKILVVEDDPIQRRILTAYLSKGGYEVQQSEDGEDGFALWEREQIRFLITDWMMPRLDGPDLIQLIRSQDTQKYTYIIMLTAREEKGDVVAGLNIGADDYLVKPCDPGELMARVKIGHRILDLESRLKEARDAMEHLARHDGLTGLLNRRAIYQMAQAELARARREITTLSVIMLDLDFFKKINDSFGHPTGDETLRVVAGALEANKREYDGAGRWGGEEFLILLPNTGLENAAMVAERVRSAIDSISLQAGGARVHVQASLGVACLRPDGADSLDEVLSQADQALYQAKRAGRNRVCVYNGED